MSPANQTPAGGLLTTPYTTPPRPRTYIMVHVDGIEAQTARVVELADGIDLTIGRSRGAGLQLDYERISRQHAQLRRRADRLEIEDLGSRNGTQLNGVSIVGTQRLSPGDVVTIGPATLLVGRTTPLRVRPLIVDDDVFETRLLAELDRSARYRRPLTLALLTIVDGDQLIEHVARGLRAMDLVCELAQDDYAVLLPELDQVQAEWLLGELLTGHPVVQLGIVGAAPAGEDSAEFIARARLAQRTNTGTPQVVAEVAPVPPTTTDPAMRAVHVLVDRIADTGITVLVVGETGAGKELVAEAIHDGSRRRAHPLIKLNCAALSETLLESELFGHERGAFTGADKRRLGFFEAAHGGTLFLDEIGEMPLALQAKLLRVLERKVVTRVGGTGEVVVDVRLVAATHRDLEQEVHAGRFRQDLFFRISGFTVVVPALRDRPSEIEPLAEHFLRLAAHERGVTPPVLTEAVRAVLRSYDWPGNVRELKHAIERAVVLHDGSTIEPADLPARLQTASSRAPTAGGASIGGTAPPLDRLVDVEREAIVAALAAEHNNQTRAARRLGLSRRGLIYKMEKHGLKPAPPVRD